MQSSFFFFFFFFFFFCTSEDPIEGHVYVKSLQEKYFGIASGVKPQQLGSLQTPLVSH